MHRNRWLSLAGLAVAALTVVAACSSAASPSATVLGATATPVAITSAAASPATTGVTIGMTADASLGSYLTGPNGMTLYVFSADTSGVSNCTAKCAAAWPPLTAAAGTAITGPTGATGTFSLIARADGTMQVAYNGMPLYYFASDSAAGDTKGQGVGGKWFVAPLSGTMPTAMPASSAAAPAAAATPAPTQTTSGY
jgi:predicted lipoprotein with Yx(FWY)xxD motif